MSGLLVAATTVTPTSPSTPSSSVSSWASTLSPTLPPPPPRTPPTASISSKKTMEGATCLAFRNSSRTARSLSPTHLLNSSGPLIERKFRPDSVARARAGMQYSQTQHQSTHCTYHGLAAAGRTEHEKSSGWSDPKPLESLGMFVRPLHRLAELQLQTLHPADI